MKEREFTISATSSLPSPSSDLKVTIVSKDTWKVCQTFIKKLICPEHRFKRQTRLISVTPLLLPPADICRCTRAMRFLIIKEGGKRTEVLE